MVREDNEKEIEGGLFYRLVSGGEPIGTIYVFEGMEARAQKILDNINEALVAKKVSSQRNAPNEKLLNKEIERLVKERDELKKRAENSEMLAEHLKRENAVQRHDLEMVEESNKWGIREWQAATGNTDVIPSGMTMVAWLLLERERLKGRGGK